MKLFKKTFIYGCEARGDAERMYLKRYTLIETSLFQICIHVFFRSDADDLHDHPWNFLTFILWRGYVEQTPTGKRRVYPGAVLYRNARHRHRVELIGERRAVTLVFMGRRWREWGFVTPDGWQHWRRYFVQKRC